MASEGQRDPRVQKEAENCIDHGIPASGVASQPREQPAIGISNATVGRPGQNDTVHSFQDTALQQEFQDDYEWVE